MTKEINSKAIPKPTKIIQHISDMNQSVRFMISNEIASPLEKLIDLILTLRKGFDERTMHCWYIVYNMGT